ncbi:hypothetical protein [Wolbachia endosymbiont of Psylliodes chrysocephala]|uniref:hypothetical protein n=1 Tax=Wolbachia endosymbiont of Psylliodes chrysocephala TaxID=2883236 RepID=UPI0020A0932A|nr:hypothetical protein [Wolbachia endosymbiont of Psylliodes chrysocephala]
MAKRQSSSRCLLAGSRDTANESRYDGSRRYDVGLLSSQCVTLGSILHVTPIVFWHKTRRVLDLFASKAC